MTEENLDEDGYSNDPKDYYNGRMLTVEDFYDELGLITNRPSVFVYCNATGQLVDELEERLQRSQDFDTLKAELLNLIENRNKLIVMLGKWADGAPSVCKEDNSPT